MGWFDNFRKPKTNPMEDYSVKLFTLAIEGVDEIRKLSEDKTVEQAKFGLNVEYFPVFNAFHNLYLHITEREASLAVGNARRDEMMKPLVFWSIDNAVNTLCDGLARETLPNLKKECVEHLNWSNETYGKCKKLFASPEESPEGTILWQFGIEVAELAERPNNKNYIITSQVQAMKGINLLDAKSYIRQFFAE
jgi:hypothetical protein